MSLLRTSTIFQLSFDCFPPSILERDFSFSKLSIIFWLLQAAKTVAISGYEKVLSIIFWLLQVVVMYISPQVRVLLSIIFWLLHLKRVGKHKYKCTRCLSIIFWLLLAFLDPVIRVSEIRLSIIFWLLLLKKVLISSIPALNQSFQLSFDCFSSVIPPPHLPSRIRLSIIFWLLRICVSRGSGGSGR